MLLKRIELYIQEIDKDVVFFVHYEWQDAEKQTLYYPGVAKAGYVIDEIEFDTENLTSDESIYIDQILDSQEIYDKIIEKILNSVSI